MGFSGDNIDIGIGVTEQPGASQTIQNFRSKLAQLRADLAETVAASKVSAPGADLSAINATIGAFQKLGQQIDVTSQKGVAGFRAEGDAISGLLARLGATDAQLGRIGATIALVEQKSGAAAVATTSLGTASAQTGTAFSGSSFALRRGADAISSIAFAAQAGTLGVKSLAPELGSVAAASLSLGGAGLIAATGIGALVTIGLTLIGVLNDAAQKAKDANKPLEDFAGLSADVIRQRATDTQTSITALQLLQNELREIQTKAPGDAETKRIQTPDVQEALAQIRRLSEALKDAGVDSKKLIDVGSIDNAIEHIQDRIIELGDLREKQQAAAAKAQETADADLTKQRLSDEHAVEVARIAATQGEAAGRRRQIQLELDDELASIKTSGANATLQAQARTDAQKKNASDLANFDAEQAQKSAEARAASETKSIKRIEDARVASAKDTQAQLDAVAQDARDAREISERQAIQRRRDAAIAAINAEEQSRLQAIGETLVSQQKELASTTDPTKRATLIAATDPREIEQQLTKAIADASAQRAKVQQQAARDTVAVVRQLNREVVQLNVQALEDEGRFLDAAKLQVRQQFRDALLEATAAGDQNAVATINARIDATLREARGRELDAAVQRATTSGQADIQRANALLAARQIDQAEAAERTVAALEKERNAIIAAIPNAERLAATLPFNVQKQAELEAYRTKLLELNLSIAAASDRFHNLKVASVDALESGIAQGIDDSITGAKSLGEAWATAADSIVHSIQRIISEMIAQIIAQRTLNALSIFGGSTADESRSLMVDAIAAQGLPGVQAIGFARGGVVRGPGTGTSDSILAAVSNGEGWLTARAVQRNGGAAAIDALNAGQATIVSRDSVRRFADGGLVGAEAAPATTWKGSSDVALHLAPGLIASVMRSSEGQRITFENLRRQTHATRALFGRGG